MIITSPFATSWTGPALSPLMEMWVLVLMEEGRSTTLLRVVLTVFFTAEFVLTVIAWCPSWTAPPSAASTSNPCAGFMCHHLGLAALADGAGPRPRAEPRPTATPSMEWSEVGTSDLVTWELLTGYPFSMLRGRPVWRRLLLRCAPTDARHLAAALLLCAGRWRLAAHPPIKAVSCASAQAWASSQLRAGGRR